MSVDDLRGKDDKSAIEYIQQPPVVLLEQEFRLAPDFEAIKTEKIGEGVLRIPFTLVGVANGTIFVVEDDPAILRKDYCDYPFGFHEEYVSLKMDLVTDTFIYDAREGIGFEMDTRNGKYRARVSEVSSGDESWASQRGVVIDRQLGHSDVRLSFLDWERVSWVETPKEKEVFFPKDTSIFEQTSFKFTTTQRESV
jgi:hypothetical protein